MSHTKGGWNRNIAPAAKYPIIFAGRNTHVAQVLSRGLPDSEIEANANLIAAAPALLEACERALALIKDTWIPDHGSERVGNAWGSLEKAITLANGIYR